MNEVTQVPRNPSRRRILQAGAGLVGGALLPAAIARDAIAADKPTLGTWPAGASGSSVFVGVCLPRTGTYAVPGEDELKGYELAVEHLNEGNALIRKIAPGVSKGVLGKEVKLGVADFAGQAEYGRAGADPLHHREQGGDDRRFGVQRRRGRHQQARAARTCDLPARDHRLQRHHRQGLRALLVPSVLLRADRGRGDHPRHGQAFRQEPEDRVPDARLYLWPHRAAVDAGSAGQGRLDRRHEPDRTAGRRRTTAPTC